MWAIICDARTGRDLGIEILALVDRAKTKQFWWTSDRSDLVLRYRKKPAADYACRRLKKNNARVVSFESAVRAISSQHDEITHQVASAEAEEGWGGHKIYSL